MILGGLSLRIARQAPRFSIAATALACAVATAAFTFPPLSGRIVDQANIISSDSRRTIEPMLADLEAKSGIQLVVATVNSLEGQEIEPYANALFRNWKLGEKTKNNGVLLLVAPKEHRVRIEVGYGLEGTLTDALSKIIIANAITPRFKAGDFNDGIARGVDEIIAVLTTDTSEWQKRPEVRVDTNQNFDSVIGPVLTFLFIFIFITFWLPGAYRFFGAGPQLRGFRRPNSWGTPWGSGSGSGGSWSGGSGGGFFGGGGSSGGGGASGSW
jgi:uncharacterized protein